MSDIDDTPKKQLEVAGSGTGGRKRTAVGAGDGGDGDAPKEFPSGSEYPSFEIHPRVVICEPHLLVRAGMKRMIPFCSVIGEAEDGMHAWAVIQSVKPELVITEIAINAIDGLELCSLVRELLPKTAILISTHSYSATRYFHQIIRNGASGIYLKRSGRMDLVKAVTETLNGRKYIDESVLRLVNQRPPQLHLLDDSLTEREIDVLIRLDLRNRDIADELGIQLKKLEKLIHSIFKKLNVETRAQAANKAVNLGFKLLPVMSARNATTGTTEDEDMACAHAEAALKDGK